MVQGRRAGRRRAAAHGFLLQVTADAPGGGAGAAAQRVGRQLGRRADYRIAYFGFGRPRYRDITTPPGSRWLVDVIDTWNMTTERQPGAFAGSFRMELPGREFMAVRLIAARYGSRSRLPMPYQPTQAKS